MDSAPGILHACQCSVPVIVAAPQEARIAVFPCVILGSLSSLMTFRHWIPLNKGHDHKQVVRLEDFFPICTVCCREGWEMVLYQSALMYGNRFRSSCSLENDKK